MKIRFRKSFRAGPLRFTIGKNMRTSVSIPGTGISITSGSNRKHRKILSSAPAEPAERNNQQVGRAAAVLIFAALAACFLIGIIMVLIFVL